MHHNLPGTISISRALKAFAVAIPLAFALTVSILIFSSGARAADNPNVTPLIGDVALDHPRGVAVDGSGNIYVSEQFSSRITKLSPGGTRVQTIGNSGELYYPLGVTVNSPATSMSSITSMRKSKKSTQPAPY